MIYNSELTLVDSLPVWVFDQFVSVLVLLHWTFCTPSAYCNDKLCPLPIQPTVNLGDLESDKCPRDIFKYVVFNHF